jgi:hypothetical protein
MKLVVHVGPHKTGTTAIQNMLSQNRRALLASGVFYPESITGRTGQHELAWAIKRWNLRLLHADLTNQQAVDYLSMFLRDAVVANANVLVLSSEDFSLLTQQEWDQFFDDITEAFARENLEIGECTITWTRRSVAALAQSSYVTLVSFGLDCNFRSVKKSLERHVRSFYRHITGLRTNGGFTLKRHSVQWRRDGFLTRWLQEVLPQVDSLSLKIMESQVNVSRPLHDSESLAIDNRLRNVQFDRGDLFAWPTYHDEASIERQRRAREVFFATR